MANVAGQADNVACSLKTLQQYAGIFIGTGTDRISCANNR